jgi:signal transduction histidine kinase/PAS domain-containing protein
MGLERTSDSAEQRLDISDLCASILEHAPLPIATVAGATHMVRYVNPAFCRLMGKNREDLIGKPFVEIMPEKDECLALLDRVYCTGEPESHTEQNGTAPHPPFWSYLMWPVFGPGDRPVGVALQVTETAKFHQQSVAMSEALMLSSVRQHELTEAAEDLNAQLRTEIAERKQTEQALARHAAQQKALYELAERANRAPTLDEIYEAALDAILTALPCDRAAILLSDDNGVMRFKAWRGLSDDYRAATEGHTPWRPYDPNPQPVCIRNVAEAALDEPIRHALQQGGIAALAFIPLFHHGELLGKFMVYWDTPYHCPADQLQLCQTIATHLGWAIERKRGQEELERLVQDRTAKLQETVGELEAFSYSVAHDLRAPLRAMHGFADLLLAEIRPKLEPGELRYLENIARSATRLDGLIQDVLNYTHILRDDAPLTRVNLDQVVRDTILNYPEFQPPKAEVNIEGTLPAVLGNMALLSQCVSNLLGNAVKFVAPGTQPKVRVWAEERNFTAANQESEKKTSPVLSSLSSVRELGQVAIQPSTNPFIRLHFQDNAIGIAPKDHARIFRMFERIHPAADFEGTGIGLTIVRKAVQRMGGQVGFESEPGKGSTFWIDLHKG